MKRLDCRRCARRLTNLEIALNLKLSGRAASTFYCLSCLADRYDVSEEQLMAWAKFFKENGCELFSRQYADDEEIKGGSSS